MNYGSNLSDDFEWDLLRLMGMEWIEKIWLVENKLNSFSLNLRILKLFLFIYEVIYNYLGI